MKIIELLFCLLVVANKCNILYCADSVYTCDMREQLVLYKLQPQPRTMLLGSRLQLISPQFAPRYGMTVCRNTVRVSSSRLLIAIILLLSGDIETYPGPKLASTYPCGICELIGENVPLHVMNAMCGITSHAYSYDHWTMSTWRITA